mmetsp:Transcript_18171/g.50554  ORF Transcript_18171/g.50554 Transcript_18171/m.50554 type:complete len:211 (-) Transcript_18171:474-1106(-)
MRSAQAARSFSRRSASASRAASAASTSPRRRAHSASVWAAISLLSARSSSPLVWREAVSLQCASLSMLSLAASARKWSCIWSEHNSSVEPCSSTRFRSRGRKSSRRLVLHSAKLAPRAEAAACCARRSSPSCRTQGRRASRRRRSSPRTCASVRFAAASCSARAASRRASRSWACPSTSASWALESSSSRLSASRRWLVRSEISSPRARA